MPNKRNDAAKEPVSNEKLLAFYINITQQLGLPVILPEGVSNELSSLSENTRTQLTDNIKQAGQALSLEGDAKKVFEDLYAALLSNYHLLNFLLESLKSNLGDNVDNDFSAVISNLEAQQETLGKWVSQSKKLKDSFNKYDSASKFPERMSKRLLDSGVKDIVIASLLGVLSVVSLFALMPAAAPALPVIATAALVVAGAGLLISAANVALNVTLLYLGSTAKIASKLGLHKKLSPGVKKTAKAANTALNDFNKLVDDEISKSEEVSSSVNDGDKSLQQSVATLTTSFFSAAKSKIRNVPAGHSNGKSKSGKQVAEMKKLAGVSPAR